MSMPLATQDQGKAFTIHEGLLQQARQVASPNQDERPAGVDVDLLVIHNISLPPGRFEVENVEALFCNTLDCSAHPYFASLKDLKVSAHLLIDRHGHITQFVPFHRKAWHAGRSSFHGRSECNDFSIGIELMGADDTAYTDEQYAALTAISQALMCEYPGICKDRITGHSDIAPERKTDPGPAFDWARFLAALRKGNEVEA